mmetsp:Transcript_71097/g.167580  ORF Transcript_71097/g.167580 Transcript_71097/m.167580 type:complete len:374 (+) Transcript_71097:3-1124(+)
MAEDARRKAKLERLGIDESQQDVFETPDPVGEPTNTEHFPPEKDNEDIDRAGFEPSESAKVFRQRQTAPNGDFSDSVAKRPQWMLAREFSISATREREFETPLERFRRLRAEVEGFATQLDELEGASVPTSVIPAGLTDEVRGLRDQLVGLSGKAVGNRGDKAVTTEIESHKARLEKGVEESGEPESTSARGSLVTLERQVAVLEKRLGNGDLAGLYPNLCHAVDDLTTRLSLVQPGRLERVKTQLLKYDQDASALRKRRDDAKRDGADTQMEEPQLERVLAAAEKCNEMAGQLPVVISRLRSLRALHETAASAQTHISRMATEQETMTKTMATQAQVVEEVKASLLENMATVGSNVAALEARIKAVEGKLAK